MAEVENEKWDVDETELSQENERDVTPYQINYYPTESILISHHELRSPPRMKTECNDSSRCFRAPKSGPLRG